MENAIPIPTPKDRSKKKRKSLKPKQTTDGFEEFDDSKRGSIASSEQEADYSEGDELTNQDQHEHSPTALEKIQEILNPTLRIPVTEGPYKIPDVVKAGDINAMQDLDERKIIELKEVFTLFDTDADGILSPEDIRATFIALGKEPSTQTLEQMFAEAMSPLDFDAFVALMCYKMIELDPEDVLLEAWSKFDLEGTGFICEDRMFHDLITFGDRFTEKEARLALEEAPIAKAKTLEEPTMIDYQAFCRTLGGLRRRKHPD